MTSEARSATARDNGRKSRGPRTPEGKATSAANATTHNFYGHQVGPIRSGPFAEDADELTAFCDEIVAAYFPRDLLEFEQATTIAQLHVKIRRVARFDIAALGKAMRPPRERSGLRIQEIDTDRQAEDAAERALAQCERTAKLTVTLHRQLDRAIAAYERLRQRAVENEADEVDEVDWRATLPDPNELAAKADRLLAEARDRYEAAQKRDANPTDSSSPDETATESRPCVSTVADVASTGPDPAAPQPGDEISSDEATTEPAQPHAPVHTDGPRSPGATARENRGTNPSADRSESSPPDGAMQ